MSSKECYPRSHYTHPGQPYPRPHPYPKPHLLGDVVGREAPRVPKADVRRRRGMPRAARDPHAWHMYAYAWLGLGVGVELGFDGAAHAHALVEEHAHVGRRRALLRG